VSSFLGASRGWRPPMPKARPARVVTPSEPPGGFPSSMQTCAPSQTFDESVFDLSQRHGRSESVALSGWLGLSTTKPRGGCSRGLPIAASACSPTHARAPGVTRRYGILPMIFLISGSEKARSVCVFTKPSSATVSRNAVIVSSSGAS
jgi:hypothetical protein